MLNVNGLQRSNISWHWTTDTNVFTKTIYLTYKTNKHIGVKTRKGNFWSHKVRGRNPQGYQRSTLKIPTSPGMNRMCLSFQLLSLLVSGCTEQPGSARRYLGFETIQEAINRFSPCTPRQLPHSSNCEHRPGAQCWTAGGGLGAGDWRTWLKFLCHGWRIQDVLLQESGNPEDRKANPAINEHAVI